MKVPVPGLILGAAMAIAPVAMARGAVGESPRPARRADALTVRSTVVHSAAGGVRRPPAGPRPVGPHEVEALGEANAWFVVESADADFGEMLPDEEREVPRAFVLRVHSDRDWELRLLPTGNLEVTGTADRVPLDRLWWRGPESGGFEAFESPAPVTVARGGPTGGAGTVVSLDLRLELDDRDPLGRYAVGFRAVLETR